MGRFLLYAVPAVVTLYAFIDCLLTPGAVARTLPRWVWLLVVVLLPFVGAVAWLLAGRPVAEPRDLRAGVAGAAARVARGRSRGPVAPDDDPSFLRRLGDEEWSRRMRARRERATDAGDAQPAPDGTTDGDH